MEGMSKMFGRVAMQLGVLVALMCIVGAPAISSAAAAEVTVTVQGSDGAGLTAGFRWLLQENLMYDAKQGVPCGSPSTNPPNQPCIPGTTIAADILATNFHKSYMPVVENGDVTSGGSVTITTPDSTKKYFLSVLPHAGATVETSYSISGAAIAVGQTAVTVVVPKQPIPTAQIFTMAFKDSAPINNALDQGEVGLGGFTVTISDAAGQVLTDVFGNPLGTIYKADGITPELLGNGIVTTITQTEIDLGHNPYNLKLGEALIKNLAPGKYGILVAPVSGLNYQQTATIEGTKTIDAWVHAKEPRYMFELGPAGHHADFGFLQPFANNLVLSGGASISGRIVNMHMSRPPDYTMHKGHPLPGCWVGLNEMQLGRAGNGLYAAACNADSTFTIPNVPPGNYQLAVWDEFLDNIFALVPVTVSGGGVNQDLGDVGVFRWFGAHEHYVFYDANENGIRDPGEIGIRDQLVNLRYRDGSIYQSFPTDTTGYVPFDEIFPFFSWQVAEVDYARFKATGVTVTVDAGGPVASGEKLTPQIQADGVSTARTETGPVLLEGFQSFLGTTNKFEWGKKNYLPNENGGITGIVHYSTTRAEDNPRYAAAETWEPGIPRVPVFLYRDLNGDNAIDDVNGNGVIDLADADHYPFGWSNGGEMGPEDVKRNNLSGIAGINDPAFIFNAGDAIQIATTDSWDDNLPKDCLAGNPSAVNPTPQNDPFYQNGKCYDGLRNFNQVRPAVFDGGYAFSTYVPAGRSSGGAAVTLVPGKYIVEAVTPKGYEHQKEEDKNVDFGDASVVSPLASPPACVGELHQVPAQLTLFPGVGTANAGAMTPLCDRKAVLLTSGQNAAADFFFKTDVPLAAQVTGFVLNDLANEFNQLSPNFSEKSAPSWLPISFRDWTGQEVVRTYTDQFGTYNAMLPSTYTINAPTPSGVSPQMLQVCLNNPGPIKDPNDPTRMIIDPFYNKHYGQTCWTLHYMPGTTLYADTPIIQIAAFVGKGNVQTDCDCADKTPKIFSVTAASGVGPFIADGATSRQLTITSMGKVQVPDPNAIRTEGNLGQMMQRDFGFGSAGEVMLGGIPLTIDGWSDAVILATVPAGVPTGQLVVKRADSGLTSLNSVTVTVGNAGIPNVRMVSAGQSIQAALDAAVAGDLILVQPGTYYEPVIMTKPVKLQGWGAEATHLVGSQSLSTYLTTWRERMNILVNCPAPQGGQITLLPGQANNTAVGLGGTGVCGFVPGTGLFLVDEGAGIFVATKDGVFNSFNRGRIDGFSVTGSATSPGIVVNGYARFLEISNNQVSSNQGTYGGGIRVGDPTIPDSGQNDHLAIHHNHILQNGSQFAPGAGVALYTGSDNYELTDNYVCGNFAVEDGAGVAHYGLSPNGLIARNKIVFNQTFVQSIGGLGGSGSGGGLLVSGLLPVVGDPIQISQGAGSVTIALNLIQGNNAGTSDGGGVMLRSINGLDVLVSPTNNSTWYEVNLFNNIIVNNVAGLSGGGIAMQDAAKVNMTNNTVAHNDSTATAGMAFSAGVPNVSNPQPAGVVSSRHSVGLCQAFQEAAGCARYSNPVMENNIVLNNRSMFWEVTTGVGQLKTAGVNDLGVLPEGSGFLLQPMHGILTDVTTGYDASNLPVADSGTVFVNQYFNAPPGFATVQPDGTILQVEFTTTLASAAALDEGGNFIDVHYGPLTPGGNYHLVAQSPAIDAGNDAALAVSGLLAADVDGQPRPTDGNNDGNGRTDIGADETDGPAGNQAPTITSQPVLTATALQSYAYQVLASDPNAGDLLSYSLPTAPAGMTVSASGFVQWTPTAVQAGTHAVTVRVQDQGGLFATQTYSVTVAPPQPAVVGFTLRDANDDLVIGPLTNAAIIDLRDLCGDCQVNVEAIVAAPIPLSVQSVTLTLSGATNRTRTDNTNPYTMPGNAGANFAGMTLNPGPHTLTATPYSGLNGTGTPGIPLTVNFTVAGPPVITSQPVTAAMVAEPYVYDVEAMTLTGAPLTYSLPVRPAGMTINATTGLISWTPAANQAGNRNVTVRVTDAMGRVTNQPYTIVVAAGTPVVSSVPVTTAMVAELYTYDVNATAAVPSGDPLAYSLATFPAGMTINATTGLISWTPAANQTGNRNVRVRVTDAKGRFTEQLFTIAVASGVPAITSTPVTTAKVATLYTYDVEANAAVPSGDPLIYSLPVRPAGMTINATTGLISWTPTAAQAGSRNVTVRVTDAKGRIISQSYSILVTF